MHEATVAPRDDFLNWDKNFWKKWLEYQLSAEDNHPATPRNHEAQLVSHLLNSVCILRLSANWWCVAVPRTWRTSTRAKSNPDRTQPPGWGKLPSLAVTVDQTQEQAMTPEHIGVVITTYNSPLWLAKVLAGYEQQSHRDFTAIIADDGSEAETRAVVDRFRERGILRLKYVWQKDHGFRKCRILNQVIADTTCDYLIFTDGDCIPQPSFVATHRRLAAPGFFLFGGYLKLTLSVSESLTEEEIACGAAFNGEWLLARGQPWSYKFWKLLREPWKQNLLNRITPAAASWNGMNSSTWTKDLLAVNGFNEDTQYGGLDREMGERLWNHGHKSRQIRFSTVCLHLDHARGYAKPEIWAKNRAIRKAVKQNRTTWARNGIVKAAGT